MRKISILLLLAVAVLSSCSQDDTQTEEKKIETDKQMNLGKIFDDALRSAQAKSDLNAFITLNKREQVTLSSNGRLAGITLAIKDNIHVSGLPNTAGTPALANFIPQDDAPVIARLVAEGAIIVGKANMHELAFGITSNNAHFGAVKNPYDKTRFAGGSSGGSASAVAARIVRAAIGSDTGGSVRLPASLCGIIGFRSSLGRYPSEGITPITHTRDVPGPMALTMADITLLDSVMSKRPEVTQPADLTSLRLGIARSPFFENLNPETEAIMAATLERLESAGVTLVEIDMPNLLEINGKTGFPIALYDALADMEIYLDKYNTGLNFFDLAKMVESEDVKAFYGPMSADANQDGRPDGIIPKEVYVEALTVHREALKAIYKNAFEINSIDALVFPTTILPAGLIEGSLETIEHNGALEPTFPTYVHNTDPGSNAGLPGISLPVGMTKTGLPVGMELDGRADDDERLLSIALAIEPLLEKLPAPKN